MKAIQVFGPKKVELVEIDEPICQTDEIKIKIDTVGICGTDIEIINGDMAYYSSGMAKYPIILGHEWCGTVIEHGDLACKKIKIGDRVVGEVSLGCRNCSTCLEGNYHRCSKRVETGVMNKAGGLAEYIVMPSHAVHVISREIDVLSAALVEPTAIAYNAIKLGEVSPDTNVAIIGDGPIGLLLLQVALAVGAKKTVMIGADQKKMSLASKLGAFEVLNGMHDDLEKRIVEIFDGSGADIVLEASGSYLGAENAIKLVVPGGKIVLQSLCGAKNQGAFNLDHVVVNDITLRGALGSPGIWPDVVRLIENGQIEPKKIVTHEFPLKGFFEALKVIRQGDRIKLVIRP